MYFEGQKYKPDMKLIASSKHPGILPGSVQIRVEQDYWA